MNILVSAIDITRRDFRMEIMLLKIFDNVVSKEPEYAEKGKRYDEEVEQIIAPLHKKMTAEEVEEIRGLIYKATYYAQIDGFVLGPAQ